MLKLSLLSFFTVFVVIFLFRLRNMDLRKRGNHTDEMGHPLWVAFRLALGIQKVRSCIKFYVSRHLKKVGLYERLLSATI